MAADDQDRISPQQGNGRGRHADPSENVLDLVQAAMNRQDDLRELIARHLSEKVDLQATHLSEKADLRAAYEDKLRKAESDRIDAIRAVDAAAVQRAAEVQAAQQQALAAQVATTADAFRASLAAALAPITNSVDDLRSKDIADLRRAQYEAQGQKTQVVETRDVRGAGNQMVIVVIMVVSVLVALVSVIAFVLKK